MILNEVRYPNDKVGHIKILANMNVYSGFTLLNFPIRKALGPLPKIAQKIPA